MAGATAVALTLVAIACTVQKKEDATPSSDTTVVAPTQLPAPAAAATPGPTRTGNVVPDDTVTTSASKERTRGSVKTSRKPRGSAAGDSARSTGGERDSATQAMFEIGPDGKLRRVKR